MKNDIILLSHGSGGKKSQELLSFIFNILGDTLINRGEDSGICLLNSNKIAITTDSFTIDPIFFPGGNIGKLSVCGTINDISVMGAVPKYITLALLIEEGFPFTDLEKIVLSIKNEAQKSGVKIIAGDSKVVIKGKLDKIFINTSGYGEIITDQEINSTNVEQGDAIIISGGIGEHSATIMAIRNEMETDLISDCQSLDKMIFALLKEGFTIRAMRDITRGGLASILNEIAQSSKLDMEIWENDIQIKEEVQAICDILGLDPLYLACEGRIVLFSPQQEADEIVKFLQKKYQLNSTVIGRVKGYSENSKILLKTPIGAERVLPLLTRELTPRIC
ncbi:MAG: hydrogenase expression/formation protein HypE [Candidatus Cloacimonadota bacterium]|nr:MAG: hydrogenase expression/formation protein HypE [Candidatus Cloacimonadota bacterium]